MKATEMTVGELVALGHKKLKHSSATPRLDAEVLLAHALGADRVSLIKERADEVSMDVERDFLALLERRIKREPVHYIVGWREFWSIPFKLNHGVLIPRPETELLVERALEILNSGIKERCEPSVQIADLGTGCGNIAVALASEVSNCFVYAIDISRKALECARENVDNSMLTGRIELLWGDLFEPLSSKRCGLDMAVSNPPYISSKEMEELPPDVSHYEPHLALEAGDEGLDCLRRIIDDAPEYLKPGGALVMEIGCGQGDAVLRLIEKRGAYGEGKITRDYAGLDRVVSALLRR